MSKRQSKQREKARRHQGKPKPSKGQLATGAGLAAATALGVPAQAQANDFTVDNLGDAGTGSLRQAALDATANPGHDRILFSSGLSGEIDLSTPQVVLNDVDVVGPGASQLTVKQTGAARVFYAPALPGGVVSISGLTITGGHPTASAQGGGVYATGQTLNLSQVVVTGNTAGNKGGGISVHNAGATVTDSTISGNTSGSRGGGIFFYGEGGANNGAGWTVQRTTVSGNTGSRGGGLFFYRGNSPTRIIDSTISGNTSAIQGGGLFFYKVAPDIEGSTISGNTQTAGSANRGGAGVFFYKDPLGGSSNPTIENTTIAGNKQTGALAEGGGLALVDVSRPVTILSSTIAGNSTLTQGGGVDLLAGAPVGPVTISNTIIGDNTAPTGPDFLDNRVGASATLGFDLLETAAAGTAVPTESPAGSNLSGDPKLGPLQNNGGPTQTMALSAISPEVDKGAAFGLNTDQRAILRPIDFPSIPNAKAAGADGSDIGAFELQPSDALKLGKLKRNKKTGTATQTVFLPLPDAGSVTVSGAGLRKQTKTVKDNGKLKLTLRLKGKKRRIERKHGKVKVNEKVTYKPTGVAPKTISKRVKLIKRLRHRH
jgi:hypothetical protein